MKILMFTNTYAPHVGGVAKSVQAFVEQFRRQGHRVVVVAPEFPNMPEEESDVVRVTAIQNFNGSDFSVKYPVSPELYKYINDFDPDIVHSHHPFLLGDTALRVAISQNVPIVFTHHTMYERYTHYVPGNSPTLKRFAMELATGYANLCHSVIAPSQSIKKILRERGVESPIHSVPTGVDLKAHLAGNRERFRKEHNIPKDAFVVGHVGRLAAEKNLVFLSRALKDFMRKKPTAFLIIVGDGSFFGSLKQKFKSRRFLSRVRFTGVLTGQNLSDAYEAMDAFAFASLTETQGMVVLEAMAAGLPVVGLDAPGVREVVITGKNGRLILRQSSKSFSGGLCWLSELEKKKYQDLSENARQTAEKLSIENCASKVLNIYSKLVQESHRVPEPDRSLWMAASRRLEIEWEIFSSRARALRLALAARNFVHVRIADTNRAIKKNLRLWFGKDELSMKVLKLPDSSTQSGLAGLIMLQIDGLSFKHFESALKTNKLPFLASLIGQKKYKAFSFYSGLPSTTPAVQAELFYGQRTAVPAFKFFNRTENSMSLMFDPSSAYRVEKLLEEKGKPLLRGGSSYSNIYSGGAEEVHFCPSAVGWDNLWHAVNPLRVVPLLIFHAGSLVRVLALAMLELILAIVDCIKGLFAGRVLTKELKFVPSRVAICVLLREFITIGAILDTARGLPVIHANFLGYDEQAHRRGPGSRFAHWTLKGIDDAVYRIWRAAEKSQRRSYSLIVYSDHGQEKVKSYYKQNGAGVAEVMANLLDGVELKKSEPQAYESGQQLFRSSWLGGNLLQKILLKPEAMTYSIKDGMEIAAMGPIGHVYLDLKEHKISKKELAAQMARKARIPLVLVLEDNKVTAFTPQLTCSLPEDGELLVGSDHPFAREVINDLIDVCKHEDAGEFVIAGWHKDTEPITFATENGAHGGLGPEETHGFVILPSGVLPPNGDKSYLRAEDLRAIAFEMLNENERA